MDDHDKSGEVARASVMVIDDNRDFREAMEQLLPRLFNVEVRSVFSDAQTALDYLEDDTVDLVLVDFKMPRMNGLVFTETVRKRPNPPKIIVISFNPLPALREAVMAAGAIDLLSKSDIHDELGPHLESLFGTR